jgi:hypothetical protein
VGIMAAMMTRDVVLAVQRSQAIHFCDLKGTVSSRGASPKGHTTTLYVCSLDESRDVVVFTHGIFFLSISPVRDSTFCRDSPVGSFLNVKITRNCTCPRPSGPYRVHTQMRSSMPASTSYDSLQ